MLELTQERLIGMTRDFSSSELNKPHAPLAKATLVSRPSLLKELFHHALDGKLNALILQQLEGLWKGCTAWLHVCF